MPKIKDIIGKFVVFNGNWRFNYGTKDDIGRCDLAVYVVSYDEYTYLASKLIVIDVADLKERFVYCGPYEDSQIDVEVLS